MLMVILGPMYADKTTRLVFVLKKYLISGKNVVMIKSGKDTRYNKDCVNSHDGIQMKAISASTLENIDVTDFDVIGIDEGQFFKDIKDFCVKWKNKGKLIYVAALNATSDQKPWPSIQELISIMDDACFMHATCIVCKSNKGSCTVKITDEQQDENGILVGGIDKYVPTCFLCREKEITKEHMDIRKRSVENIKNLISL
jgi:thymidine kinase